MVTGSLLDEDLVNTVVSGADAVFDFAGLADIGESNQKPWKPRASTSSATSSCSKPAARPGSSATSSPARSTCTASPAASTGAANRRANCISKIITICSASNTRSCATVRSTALAPTAATRSTVSWPKALEKGTITYYGAPTALREYIHVEDAALSTVEILGPEYANQNIVLTGNQPMQVGDLFRMIEEMLGKPIEIKYQHDPNSGHYQITPYAFMPKVGRKMTPHLSTELGQGVLKVMEEIHQELHPDLKELGGYLMVDKAD